MLDLLYVQSDLINAFLQLHLPRDGCLLPLLPMQLAELPLHLVLLHLQLHQLGLQCQMWLLFLINVQ